MGQDNYNTNRKQSERLFIAIEPDAAARALLAEYSENLRRSLKHTRAKWVEPENLHSTLLFFGDVSFSERGTIISCLKSLPAIDSPILRNPRLSAFPNTARARVLVLVFEAPKSIYKYQLGLKRVLENKLGRLFDERDWKPHLTLARIKIPQKLPNDLLKPPDILWKVSYFELKKSQLTPSGPIYSTIEKFYL